MRKSDKSPRKYNCYNDLLFNMVLILKKADFTIFEVLKKFWRGLEDPRSDRIYSSGNWGVKKGPGPRGTRDEEFLVPSLFGSYLLDSTANPAKPGWKRAGLAVLFSRQLHNGSHDFFQTFIIYFLSYFIRNPQTTIAHPYLTHNISAIGCVSIEEATLTQCG